MKNYNFKKAAFFSLTFLTATMAYAKAEPNPIVTDSGIAIIPFLNASTGYNDNLAKADNDLESSHYLVLEPGVTVAFEPVGQKHIIAYRLQRGDFFSSSKDDFTDHFFDLSSDWELNSKHRLNLNHSLALTHKSRGDNDETLDLLYNKYNSNNLNLGYGYGGIEAKGRVETNIGWGDLDYKNNKNRTQYQDWDELRFNTAFYYKALPKTSLLIQFIANDRNYDLVAPNSTQRDSKHYFAYVGASWDATGKLRGNAKIGAQHKNFDSAEREDFDSFSWDIDLTYLVKSYSAVQLKTNRRSTDPDGVGDAIDTKIYDINWSHNWSKIISTKADVSLLSEDYTGSSRKDDTTNVTLSFNYDFRRWLTFKLGYGLESKDSNINQFSYDQNIYYFAIEGVM
ncbi:outer membrane beta-barrel protein [Vibrio aestuarianus]|uniref:outer membrane beta-barrel protein n=1 Tax=Vibrio aestuarianus TaxID=28171 RepID=UPI003BB7A810